ncbi:organic cation transporter protein-like [Haliotis rufescens]|uniref:organic cation transporter protein-like n=1 Tax=Haliotis rufescens TaxID=6454 RepID=UPI00201F6944|nr:organic cation transporter protein-like [Haliotis rufescens]
MKFDVILEDHLGPFGTFQKRIFLLLCMPALFAGLQLLSHVFTLNVPKHRCALPGISNDTFTIQGPHHELLLNATIPWTIEKGISVRDPCRIFKENSPMGKNRSAQECHAWVYDKSIFKNTDVTELNMVCSNSSLRALTNSILFVGLLCGSIISGIISDLYGRKHALLSAVALHLGSGIGTAFSPNFMAFVIFRFFNGASSIALLISSFVFVMELVGPSKRTLAGIINKLFWCLGLFMVGGLAYLIPDWHHLQLAISAPVVLLFGFYCFVPESPRWLLSRGREKEAEKILRQAAHVNGSTLPDVLFDQDTLDNGPPAKITEMFKSPVLLIRTLIIFFNWFVIIMVFYGLALNVDDLVGDIFLNYTIGNIAEVTAIVLCLFLLDKLGRKVLHCGNMLLGGTACLATIVPIMYGGQEDEWITATLAMIGRFGATDCIIYIFSAELFPTVVRNSGIGSSSFSGRVGAIISPHIVSLGAVVGGDFSKAVPLAVFGSLSEVAGILALWLPETMHKELPESINDAKHFGNKMSHHMDHTDESKVQGDNQTSSEQG